MSYQNDYKKGVEWGQKNPGKPAPAASTQGFGNGVKDANKDKK